MNREQKLYTSGLTELVKNHNVPPDIATKLLYKTDAKYDNEFKELIGNNYYELRAQFFKNQSLQFSKDYNEDKEFAIKRYLK